MANRRPSKTTASLNQSIASSHSTSTRKSTVFPLANATKPRYVVPKKIDFNDLPDDIVLAIFRFLTPIDLLSIGTVCRRWYQVSQDESLWHSLSVAYSLHQQASPLNSKQRVQAHLNNQIKTRLKSLFPKKFDPLTSFTGIADYQKNWLKSPDQIYFHLSFCDDKHRIIWSQQSNTVKYFDTSMSIRWFDLTEQNFLRDVEYIRLFANVTIDVGAKRSSNSKENSLRYTQKVQSLLHEYKFNWNTIRNTSISLSSDSKSPIRVSILPNEDDILIATYEKDRSYAFLVINLNYLSFHELFFTGLRKTSTAINSMALSQMILPHQMPTVQDIEASVFLCIRNMTTVFLRHRFLHCRLKQTSTRTIELVRCNDMAQELGPQIEQMPKFNWKTEIFNGTIHDLCLLDLVVINERQSIAFATTLPAKLLGGNDDDPTRSGEYLLSSNVWNIEATSQINKRIRIEGSIMRLDDEYCALGRQSQSWHLQKMICQF